MRLQSSSCGRGLTLCLLLHIQTVRTGRVTKKMAPRGYLAGNAHAPSAVSAFSNRFSVFVETGENDLKTLRVDAYFLKSGEKKVAFSNENGYVLTGPHYARKLLTVLRVACDKV